MKKFFEVYKRKIELIDCTAIAKSAGDNTRQKAILIRDLSAAPGDADSIIFDMNVEEIENLNDLDQEYSTYKEDLDTVEINNIPLNDYVRGEI